jgi:hypothetical protein
VGIIRCVRPRSVGRVDGPQAATQAGTQAEIRGSRTSNWKLKQLSPETRPSGERRGPTIRPGQRLSFAPPFREGRRGRLGESESCGVTQILAHQPAGIARVP